MKPLTGKELSSLLERHGWSLLRIRGSHYVYGKEGSIVRLSVPVHGKTPLKKGLLKHLLTMAGLGEADVLD